MSISVTEKFENAGAASLSLAGDVYERAKFDTTHVNELFDVNGLRGLGCLPQIAEQVVESFMECKGYSLRVLKVLRYYFVSTDFSTFEEDDGRCAWYQHIRDALVNLMIRLRLGLLFVILMIQLEKANNLEKGFPWDIKSHQR